MYYVLKQKKRIIPPFHGTANSWKTKLQFCLKRLLNNATLTRSPTNIRQIVEVVVDPYLTINYGPVAGSAAETGRMPLLAKAIQGPPIKLQLAPSASRHFGIPIKNPRIPQPNVRLIKPSSNTWCCSFAIYSFWKKKSKSKISGSVLGKMGYNLYMLRGFFIWFEWQVSHVFQNYWSQSRHLKMFILYKEKLPWCIHHVRIVGNRSELWWWTSKTQCFLQAPCQVFNLRFRLFIRVASACKQPHHMNDWLAAVLHHKSLEKRHKNLYQNRG